MYPVVATSTKAASKASANRAMFCVLTALENVTATPLTDQPSAISTAARPKSPAGNRTEISLVEEPRTMSTARPVDSWMDAAARASLRSEAGVGPSIPRTRTRTVLMKASPGAPANRLESASHCAPLSVVRITGGVLI